jgi:molecular chaperone DnaJ
MTIKMPGQGSTASQGKHVGDLYIEISISKDPYFRREKYDIHTELNISMVQVFFVRFAKKCLCYCKNWLIYH